MKVMVIEESGVDGKEEIVSAETMMRDRGNNNEEDIVVVTDRDHGKMTEYIMGQIMYGYAPPTLGIGYEVQIVDWVHNPDPENFVVVSSKELYCVT